MVDFRALFECGPGALLVVMPDDPVFTVAAASDAYVRISGVEREDLVGRGIFEVLRNTGDDRTGGGIETLRASFQRVLATKTVDRIPLKRYDVEASASAGGGFEERYWSIRNTPVGYREGTIEYLIYAVEEVTGKVREGERERRAAQTEEALRESGERYRFLAESIPQMVWTARPDGALDYVNGQAEEYFHTTRETLYEAGWLEWVHPEDREQTVARWQDSLKSGKPYDTAFRLRRGKDGSWRWHLVRALPMLENGGEVVEWFGTCTDIHDQRLNEEELRRVNRELEEFAYVASHDLQEPLRMVNIYSQLIVKRIDGDEKLQQYAAFVREGVRRMETLLRDLLTFSRTVHREESPVGAADLAASLSEAVSVLKDRIEESGATITAGKLPRVRGETPQLAHVFQNLIANALKYRKKGVPPEIRILAEPEGEHWVVGVRDNGIGFEPQYAKQIFGLFKRLHREEYAGTGIGLAICQRIVERYGGRMWAEGRPGEGGTFYFALPHGKAENGD